MGMVLMTAAIFLMGVSLFYGFSVVVSCIPTKSDIVSDDRGRPDGKRFRCSNVELLELDLVLPDFSQEILEHLDGELLAGAAAVTEPEGREPSVVADRQWPVIDNAVDGAVGAVVHDRLPAILDLKSSPVERAFGKADLLTFGVVDLMARRGGVVAVGIEVVGALPLHRVKARRLMRAHDIAVSLEGRHSHLLDGRNASAIRGDC